MKQLSTYAIKLTRLSRIALLSFALLGKSRFSSCSFCVITEQFFFFYQAITTQTPRCGKPQNFSQALTGLENDVFCVILYSFSTLCAAPVCVITFRASDTLLPEKKRQIFDNKTKQNNNNNNSNKKYSKIKRQSVAIIRSSNGVIWTSGSLAEALRNNRSMADVLRLS